MVQNWHRCEVYAASVGESSKALSAGLVRGCLGLFLGAGTSKSMGLPLWWDLVKRCRLGCGLSADKIDVNTHSDDLRTAMDEVERTLPDRASYLALVRRSLYEGNLDDKHLPHSRLLVALGAMVAGSKRGRVGEVVTLNFDDVLERFLRLFGFVGQVVADVPELITDADVRVYHPHGFLPSADGARTSESLVFSQFAYEKLLGDHGPWWDLVCDMMARRVVLFVGLSWKDPALRAEVSHVQTVLDKAGIRRPVGFWLLGPDDPGSWDAEMVQRGVVPVRLGDYNDGYPDFILDVCRLAGETLALQL